MRSGQSSRRWPVVGVVAVCAALAAGLVWGLAGALAADPSASPSSGKVTLRIGWTIEPDNLNPFIGYATSSYEIWRLNYDFLAGYDTDLKPTPELATSWETSPDGKVWTFHLREGVKWQDGEPFTARDVAFTYAYIIENDMTNFTAYTELIDRVVAVDDVTVRFECSQPKANMLTIWVPILPEHVWSKVKPAAAARSFANPAPIVGTGPFQVVAVKKGQYVRMERNPTFWGPRPAIDEIVFSAYQNPDTLTQDMVSGNLDAAWGIPGAQFPSSRPTSASPPSPTTRSTGTTCRSTATRRGRPEGTLLSEIRPSARPSTGRSTGSASSTWPGRAGVCRATH
jgi:peptide/nickel transport system substrate-binding protein